MPVQGLSHITLIVRNLDRSARLWREGLGAEEVYDSLDEKHSLGREKFFLLGGLWIALMQGEPGGRSYGHAALRVEENDLPKYEARLRELGAEILPPRSRISGEGLSLYFYDYDDNLIELHAGNLDDRLKAYGGEGL